MPSSVVHSGSFAILPVRDQINSVLRDALEESGIRWIQLQGMSDLPLARSLLFTEALRRGYERVVCIDADIVAAPEQIVALSNHARVTPHSSVTGLYKLRSGKAWACHSSASPEDDGCQCAEWAGLGFCCIHADSLKSARDRLALTELTDPEAGAWWPFCVPYITDGEYLSDDRSLWARLDRSGSNLYVDPVIVVGHQTLVTIR